MSVLSKVWVLAAIATCGVLVGRDAVAKDIVLDERGTLLFAVNIAGSGEASVPLSELTEIAARSLEAKAALRLVTPERIGIEPTEISRCKTSPSCWVEKLANNPPKYLLVTGVLTDRNGPNVISALLIDVAQTTTMVRDHAKTDPNWRQNVDELLLQSAVIGPSEFVEIESSASIGPFFDKLFGEALLPAFRAREDLGQGGSILLTRTQPGLTIELDGNIIGTSNVGTTHIVGLRSGKRALAVFPPGARDKRVEHALEVVRGNATEWSVPLIEVKQPGIEGDIVFYSGVGATALSAGVITYALVAGSDTQNLKVCVNAMAGDPGCMNEARFRSIGSVRLAPLGFGLLTAGVTWMLGAKFLDENVHPWVTMIVGAGLGAGVYALSVALE